MNEESNKPSEQPVWWVSISPVILYLLGWMAHSQLAIIKGHWPPANAAEARSAVFFSILIVLSSWFIFKMMKTISEMHRRAS